MYKPKVLDLFSGIGGFSLGLKRAGFETIAFCEIEDYPVSILKKHWPDTPIFRDIRSLTGEQILQKTNSVDVVCGGFPCQPFSVAGKRLGKKDNRHLWPEMLRLIQETRPTWIIAENVIGLIKLGLDDVLHGLENEGYTVEAFSIPACSVGAIHRRERLWIIAYTEHNGSPTPTQSGGYATAIRNVAQRAVKTLQPERIRHPNNVADTELAGLQRQPRSDNLPRKGANAPRSSASDRFQLSHAYGGGSIKLPTEHPLRHTNDGVPDRVARLKALGNAVVPQIPEIIGRLILAVSRF